MVWWSDKREYNTERYLSTAEASTTRGVSVSCSRSESQCATHVPDSWLQSTEKRIITRDGKATTPPPPRQYSAPLIIAFFYTFPDKQQVGRLREWADRSSFYNRDRRNNYVHEKFGVWISWERLFEFGTAQPFFPPGSAGNFASGTALIQTPNFSCAEPNAEIIITYFTSSFGFRFFLQAVLVQTELSSAN